MDRAARVFAAPTQITLGGKSYRVNGKVLKHYGEVEQAILAKRPNPFKLAQENAVLFKDQPDMQRELLRLAMVEATSRHNFVTREEVDTWLNQTLDGITFALYLAIRENDPQLLTVDKVRAIYLDEMDEISSRRGQAAAEEFIQKTKDTLDEAAGADHLSNSTGLAEAAQLQADTSPIPGAASSAA